VPYSKHVFHQYTLRLKNRDEVVKHLAEKKIPHGVYYPIPLHLQEAYRHLSKVYGRLTETDNACKEVLSLPMHTELDDDQQQFIVQAILESSKK
jgi:dTDP-4-amino-4,6-dideoxygalactose transaminase